MRNVVTAFFGLAAMVSSRSVCAVETRADVESDHVDAADDGGPRALGLLVHPLSAASGWFGAEVDAACGQNVVLTFAGDGAWLVGPRAVRAAVGAAFYLQRFAFHGFYVRPQVEWRHAFARGSASDVGVGATVGYEWTWPVGASVRLGGGMSYAKRVAGETTSAPETSGVAPQIDGDLGWVF